MRILSFVLISITSGAVSHGQTQAFDVATVKLNKTGSGNTRRPRLINGRLAAENVSLRQMLQAAYGIGALLSGVNYFFRSTTIISTDDDNYKLADGSVCFLH